MLRKCCRPGCNSAAVATLTFVYSDSTAVVGPLATSDEPHSWDLCETHAVRITAPRNWELVRNEGRFARGEPDEDDLTALAEAVREAGRGDRPGAKLHPVPSGGDADPQSVGRTPSVDPAASRQGTSLHAARTGRRGHLRVLPDPEP